jgi:hypothetical protein
MKLEELQLLAERKGCRVYGIRNDGGLLVKGDKPITSSIHRYFNSRTEVEEFLDTQPNIIASSEDYDPVNHPKHYTSHPSGVECITITRHMGFNLGNVVKYVWRDGLKDVTIPVEDLKKAAWYLNDEIEMREREA